ncbi:MAG: NAD-dependent epimerase/dehydratase family protein [Gemmatimonadales bacterium]
MTVLVTGANGFVGRWVVRALLTAGHTVVGAAGPVAPSAAGNQAEPAGIEWVRLDLTDADGVRALAARNWDAVVHLAGFASGAEALKDPGAAWTVNAVGTARLIGELGRRRSLKETDPVVLVVSTAEVYAPQRRALVETDQVAPVSPYGASKRGAEIATEETAHRTGLRAIIARAFPHTGPGQDDRFVAPAFARRLLAAKQVRGRAVNVGNLEVVREFMDVRDVAAAYAALLEKGKPGEAYNVASGKGVTLRDLFARLAKVVGVDAIPETDPAFVRPADLPHLVGNASKLRATTGWQPKFSLDETLRDLVDAQAD